MADAKVTGVVGLSHTKGDMGPKTKGGDAGSDVKGKGRESGVGKVAGSFGPRREVFAGVLVPPGTLLKKTTTPMPVITPLVVNIAAGTSQVAGRDSRTIVLEDILQYEAILLEPNRTALQVWLKALSLHTLRYQERGNARALLGLIEGRLCLAEGLIARLWVDAKCLAEEDNELLLAETIHQTELVPPRVHRDETTGVEAKRATTVEEVP